jgi:hypothetical protein
MSTYRQYGQEAGHWTVPDCSFDEGKVAEFLRHAGRERGTGIKTHDSISRSFGSGVSIFGRILVQNAELNHRQSVVGQSQLSRTD